MSERAVIDYLRTRARVEPPSGFVRSVMGAIDEAPPTRSWFSALLPASAVAGVVAVIALMALLLGQVPDVGLGPSQSAAPSPSATSATFDELEAAVTAATERLAEGAVEGRQTFHIEEYLASATWFDWRPGGDHVVITREDIDVSAPWWADPDGEPLTVGERIDTRISVVVGGALYRSEGGAWVVEDPPRGPLTWGVGMLSGEIPAVGATEPDAEVRVTRRDLEDGGELWTLELSEDGDTLTGEWLIGADGVLDSYTVNGPQLTIAGTDVALTPYQGQPTGGARSVFEFTPVENPEPIEPPDTESEPDAADVGLPADFPLGPGAGDVDYRSYVEDALDALEAYHWNSATIDLAAARSAALDGLPDEPTPGQAHAPERCCAGVRLA